MRYFRTTSGAEYEIRDGDEPGELFVRRNSFDYEKRGDGDWQRLVAPPLIQKGRPVVLVMESLARYGGDDHGTRLDDVSPVTTRRTTPVVEIRTSSSLGPE